MRVAPVPVFGQGLFRTNAKNAACFTVQNFLSADIGVAPIQHIQRTVRAYLHAEPYPSRVVCRHNIVSVTTHITRPLPFKYIRQDGMFMKERKSTRLNSSH